jgi:hypothetical protein
MKFLFFSVLLFFFGLSPAIAQTKPDHLALLQQRLKEDSYVQSVINQILPVIGSQYCDGRKCAPAVAAEYDIPPVKIPQARIAMQMGLTSALMDYCGLSWRVRNFDPMMQKAKTVWKESPRNMILLSLLHNQIQKFVAEILKNRPACTPSYQKQLHQKALFPELETTAQKKSQ